MGAENTLKFPSSSARMWSVRIFVASATCSTVRFLASRPARSCSATVDIPFIKRFYGALGNLGNFPIELNLCSRRAFHLMKMPEVADIKQLQVPQARAGEPAAWDTLFRRYQLPLYVYVFELTRHEQASLDVVQETFIAAVKHLGGLREDGKFGSWLFGIAHQKVVQRWR